RRGRRRLVPSVLFADRGQSGRDLDLDVTTGRQPHAPGDPLRRLEQADRQRGRYILTAGRSAKIVIDMGAGTAGPETTEHVAQHVLEFSGSGRAASPGRPAKTLGAPAEGLKTAVAAKAAAGTCALET